VKILRVIRLQTPDGKRPYAVIQFRREKAAGELLNMVGFQSRMKWGEQKRVFQNLPGMKSAEFARFGAMHRNSFINSPKHLDERLRLKKNQNIFFAGQLTGSEGYTEALATGHYAALQMLGYPQLPQATAIQSIVRYLIQSNPQHFQPMNFNFGLLPPLSCLNAQKQLDFGVKMRKGQRKNWQRQRRAELALKEIQQWAKENLNEKPTGKRRLRLNKSLMTINANMDLPLVSSQSC